MAVELQLCLRENLSNLWNRLPIQSVSNKDNFLRMFNLTGRVLCWDNLFEGIIILPPMGVEVVSEQRFLTPLCRRDPRENYGRLNSCAQAQ